MGEGGGNLNARDPRGASGTSFELLIIGGGIYGAMLALESALRGARPLLIERDDFGAATSWNSLRIVHGGLRYLQSADLHRFGESVGERSWFLREFPDLVRPLPCLMPLYGDGLRRPGVLRVALAANDLLSRRRNQGVRADRRLENGRVLDARETRAIFPQVRAHGLRGAALWYDGVMSSSQRLLIEVLRWACAAGATVLNYMEAVELSLDGRTVVGVGAVDRMSGTSLTFRAARVVSCAGPWSRTLAARFDRDVPELFRPSLAFNVLLDRRAPSTAALAVAPARAAARTYFLHPWKDLTLAGTFHAPWHGDVASPAPPVPPEPLVQELLDDLNDAIPGLGLRRESVLRIYAGLLPARADGTDDLSAREVILDHGARSGPRGLYSVSGVKFTTSRLVAEKTCRIVLGDVPRAGSALAARPAPREVPAAEELIRLASVNRDAAAAFVGSLAAEEAACTVADLVLRRTDWGMDPRSATQMTELCRELLASSSVLLSPASPLSAR